MPQQLFAQSFITQHAKLVIHTLIKLQTYFVIYLLHCYLKIILKIMIPCAASCKLHSELSSPTF